MENQDFELTVSGNSEFFLGKLDSLITSYADERHFDSDGDILEEALGEIQELLADGESVALAEHVQIRLI